MADQRYVAAALYVICKCCVCGYKKGRKEKEGKKKGQEKKDM